MDRQQTKTTSIESLPKFVLEYLLAHVNVVDLLQDVQLTNKSWRKLLTQNNLWREVYQNPTNNALLCNGDLWKTLLQHTHVSEAKVETLLTDYLKQIFAIDVLPQNSRDFLNQRFTTFLNVLGYDKEEGRSNCAAYLKPWTVESIIEKIEALFLQLQKWADSEKIEKIASKNVDLINQSSLSESRLKQTPRFQNLAPEDYKPLVKLLLQLRQLEQMLATVLALYKIETKQDNENNFSVVSNSGWSHLLTARGIDALRNHCPTLNPGARYEKIFNYHLKKDTNEKQNYLEKEKILPEQFNYVDWIKKWGSEASEEELLIAFGKDQRYLLLVEAHFIQQLSDKTVLQLALEQRTNIPFLFEHPAFVQRLELILQSAGNNASLILLGLIQNKINFSGEELQSKDPFENDPMHFTRSIVLHAGLTRFLSNEQLLTELEKFSTKLIEEFNKILSSNVNLVSRLLDDKISLERMAKIYDEEPSLFVSLLDKRVKEILQDPQLRKTLTDDEYFVLLAAVHQNKAEVILKSYTDFVDRLSTDYKLIQTAANKWKLQVIALVKMSPLAEKLTAKTIVDFAKTTVETALAFLQEESFIKRLTKTQLENLIENYKTHENLSLLCQQELSKRELDTLSKKITKDLKTITVNDNTRKALCAIALSDDEKLRTIAADVLFQHGADLSAFEPDLLLQLLQKYQEHIPHAELLLKLIATSFEQEVDEQLFISTLKPLDTNYTRFIIALYKQNTSFANYLVSYTSLLVAIAKEFSIPVMIELLKSPVVLEKMTPKVIHELALTSADMAVAVLKEDRLAIRLSLKQIEAIKQQYDVETLHTWLERRKYALDLLDTKALVEYALEKDSDASLEAQCLNKKTDLTHLCRVQTKFIIKSID